MSSHAGAVVSIRFRLGTDSSVGLPFYSGWDIDLISVSGGSPGGSPIGSATGSALAWNITQSPDADYCLSLQGTNAEGTTNVIYSGLFDIEASPALTCNGLAVTVDFNLGQTTTSADDVVLGTSGPDVIRGKAGNDTVCGMGGDDFIHGNSGDDWVDGGDGIDNLRGGQGNDTMYTGLGSTVGTISQAFGSYSNDVIHGGADADDLRGERGLDDI